MLLFNNTKIVYVALIKDKHDSVIHQSIDYDYVDDAQNFALDVVSRYIEGTGRYHYGVIEQRIVPIDI